MTTAGDRLRHEPGCTTLKPNVPSRFESADMTSAVGLDIPQDLLDSARVALADIKLGLALPLYAQGRLSIGKARGFVGLSVIEFRQRLARCAPRRAKRRRVVG